MKWKNFDESLKFEVLHKHSKKDSFGKFGNFFESLVLCCVHQFLPKCSELVGEALTEEIHLILS